MSQAVRVTLTDEEKQFLFELARSTIERGLAGLAPLPEGDLPPPPGDVLQKPMGAFVTLHRQGALRGCIGLMRPVAPLYVAVAAMARAAAFEDRRFMPLTAAEWPQVDMEISVLGPTSPCPDLNLIELGRHGIMLEARGRTAVFLPQVPVEQGWTLKGTLEQLCRKAGLPPGTWRDLTATIYWYEATVLRP